MTALSELTIRKSGLLQDLHQAEARKDQVLVRQRAIEAAGLESEIASIHLASGDTEDAVVNLISQAGCLMKAAKYHEAEAAYREASRLTGRERVRSWIQGQLLEVRRRALIESLQQLPVVDLNRILAKARPYAAAAGLQPEDLLHEAVVATLEGRRVWDPTHVDLTGFLLGAIRSIAWNTGLQRRREFPLEVASDKTSEDAAFREALAAERLERVARQCQNQTAGRILRCWRAEPDASSAEIRRRLGMTTGEFRSGLRQIQRAVDRHHL
jgi:hypothetical protein